MAYDRTDRKSKDASETEAVPNPNYMSIKFDNDSSEIEEVKVSGEQALFVDGNNISRDMIQDKQLSNNRRSESFVNKNYLNAIESDII